MSLHQIGDVVVTGVLALEYVSGTEADPRQGVIFRLRDGVDAPVFDTGPQRVIIDDRDLGVRDVCCIAPAPGGRRDRGYCYAKWRLD